MSMPLIIIKELFFEKTGADGDGPGFAQGNQGKRIGKKTG
jgi:hypothetical protein